MNIKSSDIVFTGRGSSALFAILKVLDVNYKKILLPVNICEIIYPIVIKAGFKPVFYDVDENDGNGRLSKIIDSYTGDESVLLAVSNFGLPLELDVISKWAKINNVFLIEDICNSFGASYKNRSLGLWGDAAILSFGHVKIIEYGIGGAAIIRDNTLKLKVQKVINSFEKYSSKHGDKNESFQSRIKRIREDLQSHKVDVYTALYTDYANYLLYKIDKIDEAKILLMIENMDGNIFERNRKAKRYRVEINSPYIKHIDEIDGQIYWRYNVLVEPAIRDDLMFELQKNKVLVSAWYPPIIDSFIENVDFNKFSGGYLFSKKVLNLFVDQRVSDTDISKTIKIINSLKK